jgi:hypothetical protein
MSPPIRSFNDIVKNVATYNQKIRTTQIYHLNYWVMYPVARISIKYWNTSVRYKLFFDTRFYCALLTLHVSAPIGGHFQVVREHKNISKAVTIYTTDLLSWYV